ncbi:MAG: glycerol kinase GlpK [Clostridia bacterium]|nr:glycerol kinase GlpK [Clostridia bacterium]
MKKYILSIDQGTTSSRAILFDKSGNIIRQSQYEFAQIYPHPGWVEHDPEVIYSTVKKAVRDVIEGVENDVACLGITNQRETTVVWEKQSGKPVYNAIVWQCRRTADEIEKLKNTEKEAYVSSKTGLIPDAYFSASKIKWILDNVKDAREKAENGELLFGTVDTYLLYRLTGGKVHATDYTNASRTMLFDIYDKSWDKGLCEMFSVPQSLLPKVYPSGHRYGITEKDEIGATIEICSLVGDQQSALFGQKCWERGEVKNTYGTGCFLLMNTGDTPLKSTRGLICTLGASVEGESVPYVTEGSVFMGGAVIQWLRDEMRMLEKSSDSENIALSVPDTAGVYIVPAFVGLGAPYWDSNARGIVCGLTRGANRAHFVRAGLESIAYQTYDVLRAMEEDLSVKVKELKVDGGACANNFLMQFQSDVSNVNVIRNSNLESTAMGAGFLAGLASGFIADKSEIMRCGEYTVFSPSISEKTREERLDGWVKAVAKARS